MDGIAGVRDGDDRRRAGRAALFEWAKRKDETPSQFVTRREQQYEVADGIIGELPMDYKAILLEEGAGLSEQNAQNLQNPQNLQNRQNPPSLQRLQRLQKFQNFWNLRM